MESLQSRRLELGKGKLCAHSMTFFVPAIQHSVANPHQRMCVIIINMHA